MWININHSQKVDFADGGVDTTWGSIQTDQEAAGHVPGPRSVWGVWIASTLPKIKQSRGWNYIEYLVNKYYRNQ